MTTRTTLIFSLLMIGIALLAGILLWDQLPEQIASHWNINDEVDGTMPKVWGVFLLPLITLGMVLLLLFMPQADPLKVNIAHFRAEYHVFILVMTVFMLYLYGLTLAWSLGWRFRMSAAMLPFTGILLIAIGFLLRTSRRNFFIGIRTPWTLSSDTVWEKTNRLGAVLFISSGVLTVIGGWLGGGAAFWLMFIPLIGSTLFLTLYSYVLYRRESSE